MDKIFKPTVLTSRLASKDLERIKMLHKDILTGMQDQSLKVQAFKQQKDLERQNKSAMDAQSQKDSREADLKSKELSIKEQALYQI